MLIKIGVILLYKPSKCLLDNLLNSASDEYEKLSSVTGIPTEKLRAYGNNKRVMSLSTSKTICMALDINIDDLYEWEQV